MFFFIVGWRHWGLIFKLFIAVGFLGLITFAIVGVLKLACCKLKIRQQDAIGDDVVWQKNSMSDNNRSSNSLNEDSEIPDWLKDRSEMIFSRNLITKGKRLGQGQFGTVFKGKLNQGNAV